MELVNKIYYDGFEGEPEIQLIYRKGDNNEILIMWEGYFDQIMKLMCPDAQGWTGLAYNYNMDTGWYEESPWVIKDFLDGSIFVEIKYWWGYCMRFLLCAITP